MAPNRFPLCNKIVNKNFRLSIEINQFKDNRMYIKDSLSFSINNSASKQIDTTISRFDRTFYQIFLSVVVAARLNVQKM